MEKRLGTLLFILLVLSAAASCQVQVAPFTSSAVQFLDNTGAPLVGGKVCFFQAGTTTPQATYSDLGVTANSDPVILDSGGRATVFLSSLSYKIIIAASTADNNCNPAIKSVDNVSWNNLAQTLSSITVNGTAQWSSNVAATGAANQNSPNEKICGNYWTGSASAADCWVWGDQLGTGANPTSTLVLSHSGSSGTQTVTLPAATTIPSASITAGLTIGGPSPWADITNYGAKCDNSTDDTTALNNAIAAIMTTNNGGTVYIPPSANGCKIAGAVVLPNDGNTVPHQKTLRLVGAGAGGLGDGYNHACNGGSILNMTFSASTGKIDTRGLGRLEAFGICFTDTATDGTPFIFTTNTGLHFHDNQFYGNCSASPKQDVFIIGGTTNTPGSGATAPFQGYGTVIMSNEADCIGRFALLRVFANAVNISFNSIFQNSGNTSGGAIEVNPAVSPVGGLTAIGNLIEMTGYKYGINLAASAVKNGLFGNSYYDPGGSSTAAVNTNGAGDLMNTVLDSFIDPTLTPFTSSGGGGGVACYNNSPCLQALNGAGTGMVDMWFLSPGNVEVAANTIQAPGVNVAGGSGQSNITSNATASRVVTLDDLAGTLGFKSGTQSYIEGCNGTATAGSTLFLDAPGASTYACTDGGASTFGLIMTSPGTICNLRVTAQHAGVNASSGVVTLRKNGSDQSVTCTVGTGTSCNDGTGTNCTQQSHSFTVAAGDVVIVKYTTQGGEVLAGLQAAFEKQ